MLVVLTTTSSIKEARKLAEISVSQKLAGCAQIVPAIESIYSWKDEIQNDTESLILFKTENSKFAELEDMILSNHSYDVPEIVALDSEAVGSGYEAWLGDVLN